MLGTEIKIEVGTVYYLKNVNNLEANYVWSHLLTIPSLPQVSYCSTAYLCMIISTTLYDYSES